MVIHTAGAKRRGPHAEVQIGDRDSSLTQFDSKDVPQFTHNFSIYVLPPDAVCLYSEDRKFFLRGELYCALAEAIASGRSFGRIVHDLEEKFPADKIREAFKRLLDRRYISARRRSSPNPTAAAYWASLGLPPAVAEKNLQQC